MYQQVFHYQSGVRILQQYHMLYHTNLLQELQTIRMFKPFKYKKKEKQIILKRIESNINPILKKYGLREIDLHGFMKIFSKSAFYNLILTLFFVKPCTIKKIQTIRFQLIENLRKQKPINLSNLKLLLDIYNNIFFESLSVDPESFDLKQQKQTIKSILISIKKMFKHKTRLKKTSCSKSLAYNLNIDIKTILKNSQIKAIQNNLEVLRAKIYNLMKYIDGKWAGVRFWKYIAHSHNWNQTEISIFAEYIEESFFQLHTFKSPKAKLKKQIEVIIQHLNGLSNSIENREFLQLQDFQLKRNNEIVLKNEEEIAQEYNLLVTNDIQELWID